MTKRFAATEHAVEKGLSNVSPDWGGKLVADWIKELAAIKSPGAKPFTASFRSWKRS